MVIWLYGLRELIQGQFLGLFSLAMEIGHFDNCSELTVLPDVSSLIYNWSIPHYKSKYIYADHEDLK